MIVFGLVGDGLYPFLWHFLLCSISNINSSFVNGVRSFFPPRSDFVGMQGSMGITTAAMHDMTKYTPPPSPTPIYFVVDLFFRFSPSDVFSASVSVPSEQPIRNY